jgi:hypothetical protein
VLDDFEGGCTPEAAQAVLWRWPEYRCSGMVAASLIHKNQLRNRKTESWFWGLEVIRDYVWKN